MLPNYLDEVLNCLAERPMTARDIGFRLRITTGAASSRCGLLFSVQRIDRVMQGRAWLWSLRPLPDPPKVTK